MITKGSQSLENFIQKPKQVCLRLCLKIFNNNAFRTTTLSILGDSHAGNHGSILPLPLSNFDSGSDNGAAQQDHEPTGSKKKVQLEISLPHYPPSAPFEQGSKLHSPEFRPYGAISLPKYMEPFYMTVLL